MSLLMNFFKKKTNPAGAGEVLSVEPVTDEDFDEVLDCKHMVCPRPIFEISKKIKEMMPAGILKIVCTDPAFENDIKAWCSRTRNKLQEIRKDNGFTTAFIMKS